VQEEIKEQPKMIKGGQLKSYQMIGLNWLVSLYNNNLNGILADEMGLGKTIQTISLFCHLIESKGNEGPFLVVVPLTTISNWSMEFDKWAPGIRKIIYKGKKQERPLLAQHLKNDKFHVVLTTYEYILNDKSTLSKVPWQYIIVDEGHRMKNQKSKFALTLGQQYQSAHRVLLTGTPLQNNLSELWALLNFLLPKIFSSCDEFQKWFDKPLSKMHPMTNSKVGGNEKQAFELSEDE
jgi:ATP-dependent helicase STH1/SNF2